VAEPLGRRVRRGIGTSGGARHRQHDERGAGRAIFDQDPTPVGDPATYFFYHEGHPSTAVHRIVGKEAVRGDRGVAGGAVRAEMAESHEAGSSVGQSQNSKRRCSMRASITQA
jgi:hypothetical protein